MRAPTEEENISYTRLDTGIREGCQILKPTDRVRYLGWFTTMSDDVVVCWSVQLLLLLNVFASPG
jgi:hypothetical protein